MKKFLLFLFTLVLLVGCEYYLLTELFTQRRPVAVAVGLLGMFGCIAVFLRFFKRSFSTT